MSVLICEGLTKASKNLPIDKFNYNFLNNQIYAIVGKSDSGRETLLDLMAARIKPDSGTVYLDGEKLYENATMSKRLCYISKDTGFPGHLNIRAIFKLMASFYPKWDNAYAYELLDYFHIETRRSFSSLSSHEKQLVLGVLGLASRANITIFGTPLDDVDVKDRFDFFNFMYQHHIRYPRTLIISTDYIDEIESIIDKVLFLDKGRLFESCTIEEIKNNFRFLSGKTEVLKSLISGVKVIGIEERYNNLTVCVAKKLTKDEIRKYQKYLIKISEVPIQKVFIFLLNLREKKGIQ
ncbi:MAG: ATP-binding cassette domain-containing protein [Acholeplasmataceae bacterium]|nr:ATP-binding cassette domain-containing protein [Acholeplasmataceae bacterium]